MPLLSERYLLGDHMYEQDLPVEVRLSRDRLEILLPSTSVRTRGRNGDHPHLEDGICSTTWTAIGPLLESRG